VSVEEARGGRNEERRPPGAFLRSGEGEALGPGTPRGRLEGGGMLNDKIRLGVLEAELERVRGALEPFVGEPYVDAVEDGEEYTVVPTKYPRALRDAALASPAEVSESPGESGGVEK
jgi:hypothetical protein